jgi:Type IV secretion-system coupling protein DNA-binding domain
MSGEHDLPQPHKLLLLEIPKANDKKELAAEAMFAALHGILKPKVGRFARAPIQERISFEIASVEKRIRFYVWVPEHLKPFVEGQIYAQYPTAQIRELVEDYSARQGVQPVVHTSELVLTDNETLPIKTFQTFEVDPLAAITATLSKLEEQGEEMWIQVIVSPIGDEWHKRSSEMVKKIKAKAAAGKGVGVVGILGAFAKPPEYDQKAGGSGDVSERDKSRITAIQEKSTKLGYQVKIRITYLGNSEGTARLRMQSIVSSFKQFNTTNLNGFQSKSPSFDRARLGAYSARAFDDKGFILSIEELASLYHLPHTNVETPNIVWANSKTAEPPSNLPTQDKFSTEELSVFGVTNFRGDNQVFGALRKDRGRHIYVLGQTGVGKTKILELMCLSDIFYDQGFAVIDPHGDFAESMLSFIPERRVKDVVYFNPADAANPIGFNPLEVTDPAFKTQMSSELIGVLKRLFDSWGPRLEYILRYTLLALLDFPNSTMLDINRMLTEKPFRNAVVSYIEDPVVKTFWVTEFAGWENKFATEAVAPVLNKVGAFTANPMIRNIVGQPKSSFNIREIMDSGKILIMNLSRGLVGEDNAAILGSMMVTKIQLATMSRADIPEDDRRPFYLYVDEFQNFATDSFAVILSEARKYKLCLVVANQYIAQMEETVRGAVFGNVGTIISFRVSPDDSAFLQKYFEPQFMAPDIIQMQNRSFIATMIINGEKMPAFSGNTLVMPKSNDSHVDKIIANARENFTRTRAEVEDMIRASAETTPLQKGQTAPAPGSQQQNQQGQGSQNYQGQNNQNSQNRPNTSNNGPQSAPNNPVNRAPFANPQGPINRSTPASTLLSYTGVAPSQTTTAQPGQQSAPQQPQNAQAPSNNQHNQPYPQVAPQLDENGLPIKRKRTRSRRKKPTGPPM